MQVREDVDGRDIGVRKHAVLRTAMPGHDVALLCPPKQMPGTRPGMTSDSDVAFDPRSEIPGECALDGVGLCVRREFAEVDTPSFACGVKRQSKPPSTSAELRAIRNPATENAVPVPWNASAATASHHRRHTARQRSRAAPARCRWPAA